MVGSRSWFAPLHPSGRQWPLSLSSFVCLDGVAVRPLSHINSLWPHGLQHARLPCPSPSSRACSNSCPLSQQCHPTISSSVAPFSSCPQSFPASGSFLRIRWPRYWSFYSVLNICLLYSRPAQDGLLNGHGKEWNTLFLKARDAILKESPRWLSGKRIHLPMQETWVGSLGWEDPLEEGMANHSSILAWRITWTEEPSGLQSIGSQRVGHDWVTMHVRMPF